MVNSVCGTVGLVVDLGNVGYRSYTFNLRTTLDVVTLEQNGAAVLGLIVLVGS